MKKKKRDKCNQGGDTRFNEYDFQSVVDCIIGPNF